MQILSNGAVAIADAGVAHGRTVAGASTGTEAGGIVGFRLGTILENPEILIPELHA
jgi:hypothetical protein